MCGSDEPYQIGWRAHGSLLPNPAMMFVTASGIGTPGMLFNGSLGATRTRTRYSLIRPVGLGTPTQGSSLPFSSLDSRTPCGIEPLPQLSLRATITLAASIGAPKTEHGIECNKDASGDGVDSE